MRIQNGALVALFVLAGLFVLGTTALGQVTTSVTLHWAAEDLSVRPQADGMVSVGLAGGASVAEAGQPDLPWTLVRVPLADAATVVSGWSFEPEPAELAASGVTPAPAWRDRPASDGGPIRPEPDASIYRAATPWPVEPVLYRGIQIGGGRAEATFLVCPVRWDPLTRDLERLPGGTLTLRLSPGTAPAGIVIPRRPVADDQVRSAGQDKQAQSAVLHSLHGGLTPTPRPSLDSVPVEYLVVTTEALKPAFQPLIDWKNRAGYPAAIRTAEEIARDYPQGVDLAESIRLFLKDAYSLWGTRTVILGGDPTLIPIRYVREYSYNTQNGGVTIATDYYYACLDGNWNADGDNIWGETFLTNISPESDKTDVIPELRVGRVSALTADQVAVWVEKYLKYARDPDSTPGYLDKVLCLGEVLFDAGWRAGDADTCIVPGPTPCARNDGAVECFALIDTIEASPFGSFFSYDELYERDYWWNPRRGITSHQLNRTSTIASINAGRNILYQSGHGDRDRWAIGSGRLLTSDLNASTNAPRYGGLAYTVNCNSAAVDADCMGEAWQFAPHGGGVNYIGSTNLDFPVTARQLQNVLFHLWMNDVQQTSGSAYQEVADRYGRQIGDGLGSVRFLLYSLIFLGDPDLNVWRTQPQAMQVTTPPTVAMGATTTRVTVRDSGGQNLAGARVCFFKENDALAVALTGADGAADVPFAPTTTGAFRVTVTHPLARPYVGTGTVAPAASSWPVVTNYTVVDDGSLQTRGNGNGRIEVGETVALTLNYDNRGSAAATGLSARLLRGEAVPAFRVSFQDSTQSIGDLAVGGSGQSAGAFRLTVRPADNVAPETADRLALPLAVEWAAQDGTHAQRILPEVDRPDIELIHTMLWETAVSPGGAADSIPNNGDTMALRVELYNQGRGSWNHLRARLVPVNAASVELLVPSVSIPALSPLSSVVSDTLRFTVKIEGNFRLNLIIEDTTGVEPDRVWSRLLQLRRRPTVAPSAFQTQGLPNSVSLWWDKPLNVGILWGYRVYRADSQSGPFVRLAPGFVRSTRYVKDDGLPDMTRYWYQVAAVDSSGIEGPATAPAVASSSPGSQAGWPATVEESRDACPTVENLNGWGPNEAVFLSNSIYTFSANGDDYYDGDAIPSSRGVLTKLSDGQNFNGKCAVADILGDGTPEIIALATNNMEGNWTPPAELCVFDYVGRLLWKKVVANRPAVSAPAIGNIDSDPEKEIVFLCGKWLFAYNHDGTPFAGKPEGRLLMVPGAEQSPAMVDYQLASVALADIDDDGRDEIIFTANSIDANFAKLYVINGEETHPGNPSDYGTNVPGFPYTYSSAATDQPGNSSPAVADVTSKSTSSPDGQPDIIIATKSRLWVFDPGASGADKLAWKIALAPQQSEGPLTSSPAVGDVNGDGNPDIAVAGGSGYLYVVDGRNGSALTGFYESANERYKKVAPTFAKLGSPILADLDGATEPGGVRLPEVIIGDNLGTVYAFRKDGSGVNGFPYVVPGAKIGIGLAAWDIDRNGYQNLIIQSEKVQELQVLDLSSCPFSPADSVANPWPAFRHDARNTGSALHRPEPTPVETVALEAEAASDGITLRWRTELAVRTFVLSRAAEPDGEWLRLGEWPAEQLMEEPGSFHLSDVPPPGTWRYRIEALDATGQARQTGEAVVAAGASLTFRLHPARPNPFNPHTVIRLDLPRAAVCDLRVVDPAGRTVRRLLSGGAGPGTVELTWDGTDDSGRPVGSGVFFVRAVADGQGRAVQKLTLLK